MAENSPKIGLVTVTYNSGDVIAEFMSSLMAQTFMNFRLYAIDNKSPDDSLAKLKTYTDSRISVVANTANVGVAAGNNQGIEAAIEDGCTHILLINNDTTFGPQLLDGMLSDLQSLGCDMLVPKIMLFDPPTMIWCAGGHFDRLRGYSSIHHGEGETDHGQFDTAEEVEYTPTCCMLIKREVFDRVGMMDEKYFVYFDDSDFCLRAKRAGVKLWYSPSQTLYHKVGASTGGNKSDFGIRYGARNKVYFIRKNFSALLAIPYLSAYYFYSLGMSLASGESFHATKLRHRSFLEGMKV